MLDSDSQGGSDTDQQQNPQCNTFVEVPLLDSNGHHQAAQKQHVGVLEVLHTHLNATRTTDRIPCELTSALPFIICFSNKQK